MTRYLTFTVFMTGMSTLAIEFCASRLLGNIFGTSNLVWASIIGLILIYLTLGYALGGKWADKNPHPRNLYQIIVFSGLAISVVPFIANPVLRAAASAFDSLQLGIVFGSFAGILILFSVPITLLGTVSPYAIRLSMDDTTRAGNISGNIYAISTLGSFIGTFLPTLILIPLIGTTKTMLTFSAILLIIGVVGLYLSGDKKSARLYSILGVVGIVVPLLAQGNIKQSAGQIYETESAYNYIQVLQSGEYTYLRLNDGQGIHSEYHPTELYYAGPWEQFLVAPFFNENFSTANVKRIAIVGLAAGTTARQATAVFGAVPIDGIEIDAQIVEAGKKYFGMTMPNLNVIVGDGRWELEHSPHTYSIIAVDAYRPPYIPPHLTTQEFFKICVEHLSADGVLAINVGRAPSDRRLIEDLSATIGTLLPSVYVMDIPNTFNSIIYATKQTTTKENLVQNYIALVSDKNTHPLLLTAIQIAYANMKDTPQGGMVFTDDLAPIEWITNGLILNFVFTGGVEEMK